MAARSILEVAKKLRNDAYEYGNWNEYCVHNGNGFGEKIRIMSAPVEGNAPVDSTVTGAEPAARTSLRARVRQAIVSTESEIIREMLERHRWNRRKTAEALQISYRSLMYKMKHCNLRDDQAASSLGINE
jgi:DNA-binding NtrC family response regulator